ncbi:tRNA(Phe) (4-demethylwyosine(37)-C(7)) aminocarboxypropyltransferase [Halobacterium hubeiense]|uniref:tRNA(Phe) (4-demethylwyosine(37)-C(7)) aminocarboxypropyltransferase n=1 Tax=Halobacterium hubeiense TaxID=1407499 RepID=A0A0U5H7V0_9EURY|nr:class I SAM-dependent methyltransferase family protein [Halobacterium hubeiense]CQH62294.1 tRNA(Phe) (4-demethylwyosine(37)-C(7)) aminocarboxypropyltransferase [Halobacterium hubeiense]
MDLAVVVPKPDSEARIADLEAEGVYDDARKIREHDADRVELPVSDRPRETDFDRLVEQDDPELRAPGLDDLLRERGWSDAERDRAPSSWAVVGTVILADFTDCPRRAEVGDALLDLHSEADTVLARGGIDGEHREPDVSVVAGEGDTETVHTEHGTQYALDLSRVMFAPGNKAERARMGEVVAEDERVLDMFAGVGYFALPMARAGARVTAVEKNPESFRYLAENAQLNGVSGNLDCVLGDCREVDSEADRVVMGYYDALGGGPVAEAGTSEGGPGYLDAALDNLVSGGVLHVHSAVPEAELWERPESRLRAGCERAGRTVEIGARRRVKSHSAGVEHVVLDARVD